MEKVAARRSHICNSVLLLSITDKDILRLGNWKERQYGDGSGADRRVTVEIEVVNGLDFGNANAGKLPAAEVRRTTLNARVDTGATMLVLPKEVIQKLGLQEIRKTRSLIGNGKRIERTIYGPVRIKVQGREIIAEAADSSPGVPPLLGQIPLESIDFHVDPNGQRLLPNPDSPDMAMIEIL